MRFAINLSDIHITIEFLDQSNRIAPLYRFLYREFIINNSQTDGNLKIRVLQGSNSKHFFYHQGVNSAQETVIANSIVKTWLANEFNVCNNFSITNKTMSIQCLNGLLLFSPEDMMGHIYIFQDNLSLFRSLFHLIWIYFAQLLGERACCFLHAAALTRNGHGYIFLGDSGAGKSTLARIANNCKTLDDESPIISCAKDRYFVYPSPFHQLDPQRVLGKEVVHERYQIAGLYFLMIDDRTFIETIPAHYAISMIVDRYIHFFHCFSSKAKAKLFDLFFEACHKIPIYTFHFSRDMDIWRVIT